MSEPIASPPPTGEGLPVEAEEPLQFDQAEFETPAAEVTTCTVCRQPIPEQYYEINGRVMCPRCRHGVEAALRGGSPVVRFLQAAVFGGVAAAAGAIVYYGSVRVTNMNLALVSILVGFLVGKAVRQGTGNRGGSPYQILAVLLTYSSLVGMNVLLEIDEVSFRALIERMIELFPFPIREGLENPLRGVIYAIALWEAWRLNRPINPVFTGPFRLGAARPVAAKPEGGDDGS